VKTPTQGAQAALILDLMAEGRVAEAKAVAAMSVREFVLAISGRNITERKDRTGHEHAPAGSPKGGQFVKQGSGGGGGSSKPGKSPPEKKSAVADEKEHAEARKQAHRKILTAPVPTPEKVAKMRAALERAKNDPKARAGGDARGSSADRRARAKNLFREFGGEERGYVVCHGTGIRLHWTTDPEENPHGYPKFEQGKIFTAVQGGGYQLPNLLPESFAYNRSRNDAALRTENLPAASRTIQRSQGQSGQGITGHPTAEHRELAAAWVDKSDLPDAVKTIYTEHLSHVLSALPPGALKDARDAVGKGKAVFHPDQKSLAAEAARITGRRESGTVGFVRQLPGGAVEMHLDGGDAAIARGTYAHELWHAVDTDRFYSDSPGWQKAYKKDILKGRTLLSRYALESPAEGFAEFGRGLAEKGPAHAKALFPTCSAYLESKGLL
jgi:hypothetical protein